jgi:type IV pilus assembly protein PilP
MNKRKRRSKKSLRYPGAFLVSVFFSLLVVAGQGWCASSSLAPAFSPGSSGKKDLIPISYVYYPSGKPDPFQPFVEKDLSQKKLKAMQKVKPLSIFPLQRAGIGEFKLVGIAGNEQGRTAVVTNVRGNFFPLSVGTVIGLNGGKVTEILEDRVIVEERTAAGKGQYKTRRIPLKLQKVD